MRRIFAIAIGIFIGFWIAYGLLAPVKATVNDFVINTAGPTAFNAVIGVYNGILGTVGVGGFAAIVLGGGFVIGMFVHRLWVKTDWKLRRWGAKRTQKDLGVQPVTHIPSTPVGATTRPTPAPVATVPASAPIVEEKKEEAT